MGDDLDDLAAAAAESTTPRKRSGGFICRNCGHRGRAKRKAKGSILALILLLLIGVLPGLLYMIFYSGHVFICPRCKMKVGDAY